MSVRVILAVLSLGVLIGAGPTTQPTDPVELQTHLQIALQRHIDRTMINGGLVTVLPDTGDVVEFFPIKVRPLINQGDGFYILSAEFKDVEGNSFGVDYVLVPTDRGFRVVRTEFENPEYLSGLRSAGKVSKL